MSIRVVKTQAEWDAVPENFADYIEIRSEAGVVIEVLESKGLGVTACDSSMVRVYNSSTVTAYNNSTVTAYNNSTVTAYNNSTVRAYGNSTVRACDSSTVRAYGSSTVTAYDNSTVTARTNVQILRLSDDADLTVSGNARIVTIPSTAEEWADYYGLAVKDGSVIAYKAVRANLASFHNPDFVYSIGQHMTHDVNPDREAECATGLHIAYLDWAWRFGESSDEEFRILEVAAPLDKLIIPKWSDGKVRTSELTVIREVPKEEWR